MRHTFATLALVSGVPIDDVASILGHSNVSITFDYYRKWVRGMKDRARSILDTWEADDGTQQDQADAEGT
jgi:integrase